MSEPPRWPRPGVSADHTPNGRLAHADGFVPWITPTERSAGLANLRDALRGRVWILVVCVVLAVGATALQIASREQSFAAEADLLVTPLSADVPIVGLGVIKDTGDPNRDVETVARLVTTSRIADRVKGALGLPEDSATLLGRVSATPVPLSNLIAVEATAPTAAEAARLANGFATALVDDRTDRLAVAVDGAIARLESRIEALGGDQRSTASALVEQLSALESLRGAPDPTLRLETAAVTPEHAVTRSTTRLIVVALLGGGVLGLLIVLGLHELDRSVRSEDQLLSRYRLPIVGRIPRGRVRRRRVGDVIRRKRELPLVPSELTREAREAYRQLQTTLRLGPQPWRDTHTVLVTGGSMREGKTTTALNLSWDFASAGLRVILVEADLRTPGLGAALGISPLGLSPEHGLDSVAAGRVHAERALVPIPPLNDNLRVLFAGASFRDNAQLNIERALDELKSLADCIVVDAPPLAEAPELVTSARACDHVLLVVRLGSTILEDLARITEMLSLQLVTPTGFVVVGVRPRPAYAVSERASYRRLVARDRVKDAV
jgi:Mrp family chromosome partitioning ATPase/capsular polysaccharide biosynthesis protein